MIVVNDAHVLNGQAVVATIGFFDGVHLGHRFLIHELIETAKKEKLPSVVITFPEHPRAVLHSDYQPKLLNSFDEKIEQLSTTGVDYCIILPFTPELSQLPARSFIAGILKDKLCVQTLLIGYDHRFGHNRADGFEQYVQYGTECDINVIQATAFDEGNTSVSSSEIRKLLLEGQVEKARQLLTYPYMLKGTIVSGHKVGRTIGFPTANIQVDEPFKIIPGIGIYAVRVLIDNECHNGMLYIGSRPTLHDGEQITMEVNIFNFNRNIYNNKIEVFFEKYVRDDIKFDSLEALKQQLAADRQIISALLTE